MLEDLGNPGLTYRIMYTVLGNINEAGECTGHAVAATSGWPYVPVRYTDGPLGSDWTVFSDFPLISAGAGGLDAAGDTVFHLGIYGTYVWVDGVGTILLQSTLDPAYADWDLTDSFVPAISRRGLLATNGADPSGQAGIVLLTPTSFESLAFLGWSATSVPAELFGGTVYANPLSFLVPLPTDALGRFEVTFDWPSLPPGHLSTSRQR